MIASLQSLIGIAGLLGIAWLVSENRREVRPAVMAAGVAFQLLLAVLLLKTPFVKDAFGYLNALVLALQAATEAGTTFVFGFLGGGAPPYVVEQPTNSYILAFRALPLVLVVSALSALLFHWRVLPLIVGAFARLLERTLGIGGALGLSAAANVFVGMTESPLLIRPYLRELSRSELFAVMACGMATIAGTVMVLYATLLQHVIPDAVGHILVASLISAPAALTVARVMVPEPAGAAKTGVRLEFQSESAMDAITRGTLDGLKLLLNIIALLVVFVALVHLANQLMGLLPAVAGEPLTLQRLLGWIMAPLVWLIGIPWTEARAAGSLMGVKTVLNELLAYLQLAELPEGTLSERSRLIMTYALCGFANFGSLGIMIGGLGLMVPERRREVIALGMKSLVAGTLATLMTGAMAGLLL